MTTTLRTRRRLIAGSVLVPAITAAVACAPGQDAARGGGAAGVIKPGTKLSFASWGGPDVQENARKHADQFHEKHPGVTVEYVSTAGQNHIDKLTAAATAGAPIDVFYLSPSDTPTLATRGLTRPIADITAPPRRSVLTSRCFSDPSVPPKGIEEMVQAPEFVHTDPRSLSWTDAEDEMQKALGALWDGTKPARQIATELVPQVNRILKAANG